MPGEVKLIEDTLNGVDITPLEIKKNEAPKFPTPKSVTETEIFGSDPYSPPVCD